MSPLFEVLGRCLGTRKYFITCKSVVNDFCTACGSILTFISRPITCPAKHHLVWHCCLCEPSPQASVCSAQTKPWSKAFMMIIIFAGLPWWFILLSSESWWSLSNTHLKSINSVMVALVISVRVKIWSTYGLPSENKKGAYKKKKRRVIFLHGHIGIGQGGAILN